MRTIALYIALAAIVCSCSKNEQVTMTRPDPANASIHYSRSVSNPSVYYFVIRTAAGAPEATNCCWSINGKTIPETGAQFQHHFSEPGEYSVSASVNNEPVAQTITVNALPAP
jgi:hypothetical protein